MVNYKTWGKTQVFFFYMKKTYLNNIKDFINDYRDEAKDIRRSLHQIPEIGYKEFKTQAFIQDYLKRLEYNPENIIGTGTVLFIPGTLPGDAVAIRTDIDALPVQEPEGNNYRSRHEGFMHACGHDGHMTMMLLTAKILKEHPEIQHRDLLMIFQPAEEGPGGAQPIVETGIFDKYNIKEIYGYHLLPDIEEGIITTTPGPMFAMTSEFYPVIRGKSSHAGNPENGIDAIVAASAFVMGVQTIISRNVQPNEAALINIGTFKAGERMNIVAKEARLTGTLRSYNKDVQNLMKKRLEDLLEGIDKAYGTESEINYVDMYDPLINDSGLFEKVWELIPEPKARFEKVMMAEDFAQYTQSIPGVFIGIGTKNDRFSSGLHTDTFNFDEDVLLRGIDLYLRMIGDK